MYVFQYRCVCMTSGQEVYVNMNIFVDNNEN